MCGQLGRTRFSSSKTMKFDSNAIKSVLTLHDSKRMVKGEQQLMESVAAMAVSGGFPCFEKNLPYRGGDRGPLHPRIQPGGKGGVDPQHEVVVGGDG